MNTLISTSRKLMMIMMLLYILKSADIFSSV